MSESTYPQWESLVQSGDFDTLIEDLETWRTGLEQSLEAWLAQCPASLRATAEALLVQLEGFDPEAACENWPRVSARVTQLNLRASQLHHEFLVACGPTDNPSINAILHALQGARTSSGLGTALFRELKSLENWAQMNRLDDYPAYRALVCAIEDTAFACLGSSRPDVAQARTLIHEAWHRLLEESQQGALDNLLAEPTRSPRWNSWLLLLQSVEEERADTSDLVPALAQLDGDVRALEPSVATVTGAEEVLADYWDVSQQLHQHLSSGRRVKGWSQVLQPVLIELDGLWTPELQESGAVSQVRRVCQQFEASQLSTATFQSRLQELRGSLQETRKRAAISTPGHPLEAQFLAALGKLESGLDILSGVERPSQGSQMEMGCGLIDDGLREISELERQRDQ